MNDTDTDTDTKRAKRRERRRKTWRAIRRAAPALLRALAGCADEVVEALADGRVTTLEATAIGLAFAEELAGEQEG